MPIRINLLADQQAAEELRRRDPIKRAVFGGCALLVLIIGWIATTQMQVWAARHELNQENARMARVEGPSKAIKNKQVASLDAEGRLKSLDRYADNRFFWGTFLDALQHAAVDNVRVIEVHAEQKYTTTDPKTLFSTNIIVTYKAPAPGWKFWATDLQAPSVTTLATAMLGPVTNAPPFTTNTFPYTIKITENSTNAAAHQVVTTIEFILAPRAVEKTTIEIRGRDYGSNPGAAIDEFARRINSSSFFKSVLTAPERFRFTERPPQARPDPQDPINPSALFVPFTIEMVLDERNFTNEQNL
jgi:hypothetical protein